MAETLTVVRDFFKDLEARGLSQDKLMSLDVPRRKEAFLRWKWFDSSSYSELEGTRRSTMHMMTKDDVCNMGNLDERKYWTNILKFEEYCTNCLKRIGVLPSDAGTDTLVKSVAEKFAGTVTGGYERKDWND